MKLWRQNEKISYLASTIERDRLAFSQIDSEGEKKADILVAYQLLLLFLMCGPIRPPFLLAHSEFPLPPFYQLLIRPLPSASICLFVGCSSYNLNMLKRSEAAKENTATAIYKSFWPSCALRARRSSFSWARGGPRKQERSERAKQATCNYAYVTKTRKICA